MRQTYDLKREVLQNNTLFTTKRLFPTVRTETMTRETLVTLARKMMLTPKQAAALRQTVETAAGSVEMTDERMVSKCYDIPEVCEYLASICRTATA